MKMEAVQIEQRRALFTEWEKLQALVIVSAGQVSTGGHEASERYMAARDATDAFVRALIFGGATFDGSAAREDEARWAAGWALKISVEEMRKGAKQQDLFLHLRTALKVLAEAQRQVAEARAEG